MPQIGQILSQTVPLSDHDLEEILQEQKTTRQRFGEVALALGKATPGQVWEAWLTQLQHTPVDLDTFQPEPAAVAALPIGLATLHGIVPLRVRGNELVVAVAGDLPITTVSHIIRRTHMRVIVAHADRQAVETTLARLYPTSTVSAA